MTTRSVKEKQRYKEEKKKRLESIKWDKKSIIRLILITSVILAFIIAINIDFRGYNVKNNANWAVTCGKILSIKPIDNREETRGGNRFVTEGYLVKYNYEIDRVSFHDSIYLSSRAIKNKLLINKIRIGDSRKIYYNKANHKESHIDTNLESTCE